MSGISNGYLQVSLVAIVFSVVAGFYYVRLVQLIYYPVDFSVLLWQRTASQVAPIGFRLALLISIAFYLVLFALVQPGLLLQLGFWATLAPF